MGADAGTNGAERTGEGDQTPESIQAELDEARAIAEEARQREAGLQREREQERGR